MIGRFLRKGAVLRRISRCFMAGALAIVMIAASITTYAWYAKNEQLKSDQMMLGLTADDAAASYTVYKYDISKDVGSTQQEKKDTEGNVIKDGDGNPEMEDITISNIDFNQYDLIFTKRNRYTPVFAHIVITRIATTPDNGEITLTVTSTSPAGTLTQLPYKVSSVLRFTALVDETGSITDALQDADDFYMHVDELMYLTTLEYSGTETHDKDDTHDDASGSFFTEISDPINNDGKISYTYTRSDSVELTLEYSGDAWVEQGGDMVLNIYLYMTYDTELISCLTNENDMQVISIDQSLMLFENDLDSLWIQCNDKGGSST